MGEVFHENVKGGLAPELEAFAFAVPLHTPKHRGFVVVMIGVGRGFIVTVAVAVAVHPPEFVAVTV